MFAKESLLQVQTVGAISLHTGLVGWTMVFSRQMAKEHYTNW
jgi:hypothetical protein